jgi:hypothetical protein
MSPVIDMCFALLGMYSCIALIAPSAVVAPSQILPSASPNLNFCAFKTAASCSELEHPTIRTQS